MQALAALPPDRRAALALATAALLWAGNFIAGRALRGSIDPVTLNMLRWLICLAAMLPWVTSRAWRCRHVVLREWRLLAALGATGIAAFHAMAYQALTTTTASSALIVLSLAPAAILLAGAGLAGSRPTARQWAGTGVSLAGAAIVVTAGAQPGLHWGSGALWMGGAVLVGTAYSLLLRRRPGDLPQDVALAASIVPGIVLLLGVLAFLQGGRLPVLAVPALTPMVLAALAYVGLFASLLAFLLWSYGVGVLGPGRAGQFIHLMPVFGMLLAAALLDERLLPTQAAGGLCVFAGIALGQHGRPVSTNAEAAGKQEHPC